MTLISPLERGKKKYGSFLESMYRLYVFWYRHPKESDFFHRFYYFFLSIHKIKKELVYTYNLDKILMSLVLTPEGRLVISSLIPVSSFRCSFVLNSTFIFTVVKSKRVDIKLTEKRESYQPSNK